LLPLAFGSSLNLGKQLLEYGWMVPYGDAA
jgi:hypothetical protein